MSAYRVVVDGSNLATEGRSTPSLAQLDEAVRDFLREFPGSEVTVVVDASFGHRIDEVERPVFEEAVTHGEVISPPAGAVGRGDAFLLRIAERTGATVLSNDSFQEFHGDHQWLFSRGRLVGGKPVPGVGWIFTPRTPVRGVKSKQAIREAKASEVRLGSREASRPMPVPTTPPPSRRRKGGGNRVAPAAGDRHQQPSPSTAAASVSPQPAPVLAPLPAPVPGQVQRAIADATEEALTGDASSSRGRRRRRSVPPQTVNDPLTFIKFIAEHPLGAHVEGEVERFTSHGAFVVVDGAHCYVPLSSLGNPMPRRARDVLSRGVRRTFVLQALDPQRRGVELALPEFAQVSGEPRPETVDAEIAEASHAKSWAKAEEPQGATVAVAADAAAGTTPTAKRARRSRATVKAGAEAQGAEPETGEPKAERGEPKAETGQEAAATKATRATKAAKATKSTRATRVASDTSPEATGPEATGPEATGAGGTTDEGGAGAAAAGEATARPVRKRPPKKAPASKSPAVKAESAPDTTSAIDGATKAAATKAKAAATKAKAAATKATKAKAAATKATKAKAAATKAKVPGTDKRARRKATAGQTTTG